MNVRIDEFQKTTIVKTLDGEKEYTFQILPVGIANEVFHNTVMTIIRAFEKFGGEEKNILLAIQSLEYEQLHRLSKALLVGMLVNKTEIGDVDTSKYWRDYPEEIYIAVVHAIKLNWPGVFTRMLKGFSGLNLQQKVQETLKNTMLKTD